jgi:hypothetical protein
MSQLSGRRSALLQMVRYTKSEPTDDPGYLDWVEATMVGVEESIDTKQFYVFPESVEGDAPPGRRKRLHVWQRSGENLQRYTEIILHGSNAFWYSGRTASNDRGSFMAYVSTPDGHWPWYVSVRRDETWRVVESIGIGVPELEAFTRLGIAKLRRTGVASSGSQARNFG